MRRVRFGWAAAVISTAAATLLASGCTHGADAAHPAHTAPRQQRLSRLPDLSKLGLPAPMVADAAYRLPADVRVAHYGVQADGAYLAFGVEPASAGGSPATRTNPGVQPPDQPGRYAVVRLADGLMTLRDSLLAGAHTDYVAVVDGGGSHLVRVEAVEQPASACPASPVTCYSWQITDQALPDGAPAVIAKSTQPAPVTDVPQPISAGDVVVWLQPEDKLSQVYTYRPGTAPRAIGDPVPTGILSVAAGAAWIGTPPGDESIRRVPLDGSTSSRFALPPTAGLASATDGQVAFRVDDPGGTRSVCVADLTRMHSCQKVYRAADVYGLYWLGPHALVVSGPDGYALVSGDAATPLPLDYLYLLHSDGHRVTFTQEVDGRQILVVAHLG